MSKKSRKKNKKNKHNKATYNLKSNTVKEEQVKDTVIEEEVKDTVTEEQPKDTLTEEQVKDTAIEEEVKDTVTEEQPKDTLTEEQPKSEIIKTSFLKKHRDLIMLTTAISATALLSTMICYKHFSYKMSTMNLTNTEIHSETTELSAFGQKLISKNLIKEDITYNIDFEYDHRFESLKDTLTDSYVISSTNTDNPQDIYILRSTDPNLAHSALIKCKDTFLLSKNDKNEKVLNNIKVDKVGDYVYLIAAENADKIEKLLLNHID